MLNRMQPAVNLCRELKMKVLSELETEYTFSVHTADQQLDSDLRTDSQSCASRDRRADDCGLVKQVRGSERAAHWELPSESLLGPL